MLPRIPGVYSLTRFHAYSDSSSSDIDEMLDRDGQELEALLSQLDLDFDQVMSDASHRMLSMQCT